MCRLFALHADQPVTAKFWLLDAPYSLRSQSRYNADGTGIGYVDESGISQVRKRPVAAHASSAFTHAAQTVRARSIIAHLRLSSGTQHTAQNTHPFLMDGILLAHNGVLEVTQAMRHRVEELGATRHVHGTTDSEWLAALVAGEAAAHAGDLHAGIVAAIGWVVRNVPVYSLNLLAAREEELFALRLPETNELWVLERPAAPRHGPLDQSSDTLHARSEDLDAVSSVVLASEPMDEDPCWRLLEVGELVRIGEDGAVHSSSPFPPLAHPLHLEDLNLSAATSQMHAAQDRALAERRARIAAARAAGVAAAVTQEISA